MKKHTNNLFFLLLISNYVLPFVEAVRICWANGRVSSLCTWTALHPPHPHPNAINWNTLECERQIPPGAIAATGYPDRTVHIQCDTQLGHHHSARATRHPVGSSPQAIDAGTCVGCPRNIILEEPPKHVLLCTVTVNLTWYLQHVLLLCTMTVNLTWYLLFHKGLFENSRVSCK